MRLKVDAEKCTLCGACIETCPSDMVRMRDNSIRIGRVACLACGHCLAICPVGAISDTKGSELSYSDAPAATAEALTALIKKRRTVRRYKPDPVPQELLEELIDTARWTPTAANAQTQEYVALTSQAARDELRLAIEDHYRAFAEALADKENRVERVLALGHVPEAADHPHIRAAVPAFVKSVDAGRDRLFFEAPAVIVIHSDASVVMPEATCAFAALMLTLLAEAHGLANCVVGFASDALQCRADLREQFGIPEPNQVYIVLVLGYPDERFSGIPDREPAKVVWR